MIDHGLRWSDSEMTAKSWPSGAPTRAAAACIADRPGTTRTSMSAKSPLPDSTASSTAVAIAKMPGSPDETTATLAPAAASASAWRARSSSTRLSLPWRRWPARGGTRSRYGP